MSGQMRPSRTRAKAVVFKLRSFVATCANCGDVVANEETNESEFNECDFPIAPGTLLCCTGCGFWVRMTDPAPLFSRPLRGGLP
jgi:hypothetical protein